MVDPLSGTVLGATFLTEGIKFLYGQAGELLKRWRERREAPRSEESIEPLLNPPAGLVARPVQPAGPDYTVVQEIVPQLKALHRILGDYVSGVEATDVNDRLLQQRADAMRLLLECVYRQPIVFTGETRSTSRSVWSKIVTQEVLGVVKGVVVHGTGQAGENIVA